MGHFQSELLLLLALAIYLPAPAARVLLRSVVTEADTRNAAIDICRTMKGTFYTHLYLVAGLQLPAPGLRPLILLRTVMYCVQCHTEYIDLGAMLERYGDYFVIEPFRL